MKCISNTRLQSYIDRECTATEAATIKQHLSECIYCRTAHQMQLEQSMLIKMAVSSLNSDALEVPVFEPVPAYSETKNRRLTLYSLAAASVLLFILLFVDKSPAPPQQEIFMVQSIPEYDANQPLSGQTIIMNIIDPEGQCSEYFID